jgi:uncharacterized protein (DUF2237 family)
MGFTFVAITVVEMQCVIVGTGTPSCTIDPYHNTARNGGHAGGTTLLDTPTACTNITTGDNYTGATLNDVTIPADSWIVFHTTTQTTCTEVTLTIKYTIDA